ncbi:hypothetical protein B0H14DRAFT_2555823 [Mycena olivaceomarginata]|nr:hypothetical protein B0H14DRAFT_2555823 [Mycena olivaceomarginata]
MDSPATDKNELTNSQKWPQGKADDEILSPLPFLLGCWFWKALTWSATVSATIWGVAGFRQHLQSGGPMCRAAHMHKRWAGPMARALSVPGRRNCEGWTCRSNGEYNLGVPNLASFGELACEKGEGGTSQVTLRQHGEFPWNQKENTYLVPGAKTRWPSDVGWLDQEITGIQFAHAMAVDNVKAEGDFLFFFWGDFRNTRAALVHQLRPRVMSQTTPGSENNLHLVDMPPRSRKRKAPDQAVGRAVFPLGTSGSARNPFIVTDSPPRRAGIYRGPPSTFIPDGHRKR